MIDNERHWFAAVTRAKQEKSIKERLDRLSVENFVPLRTEVRQWKYRRKKVTVPAIPNLVFLHTDRQTGLSLVNEYGFRMRFMQDKACKEPLVVPEKQMHDFMFLFNLSEGNAEIFGPELEKGDRVRIVAGPFAGIEGELLRINGTHRVVVRLEGIATLATTTINRSLLEKL